MRRAAGVAFGLALAALGGYVIVASVHRAGPPTLTTAVFGGALVFGGAAFAFPRRSKAVAQQLIAALAEFWGRGGSAPR